MSGKTLNFFFLTRLIEFVHFSEIKQNTSPALLLTGEICLYTLNNISITILRNLPALLSVSLVNPWKKNYDDGCEEGVVSMFAGVSKMKKGVISIVNDMLLDKSCLTS